MSDGIFFGRIEDMLVRADRGVPVASAFFSPAEQVLAGNYLASLGRTGCVFFGGYDDAERKRLFAMPEYAIPDEVFTEFIVPLKISGSGYHELTHSDFLGALTGLRLKRDVIGDILLPDTHSAVVFFDSKIADWLSGSEVPLEKIGADTVSVSRLGEGELIVPACEFEIISDTVASPRLDCVVGALCRFAREKAKSAILSGDVMLNHIQEKRPDRDIHDGDTVTIKHIGKFRIDSITQNTRRGRIRLSASKYK